MSSHGAASSSAPERGSVGIIGAGPFGRSLAAAAVRAGKTPRVYSRDPNAPKIEDAVLTDDVASMASCELLLLAVPSEYAGALLERLSPALDGSNFIVHVSRGLVDDHLNTMSHLVRRTTPVRRLGALAGPLTARNLSVGHPAGGIVGSAFPEVIEATRAAIGCERLRLYGTPDLVGVELASALTGMLLFALGYARGMGLSPATLGVLGTRGLAEMTRVGTTLGGRAETFSGLAGVGDLMAALAGAPRPEFAAGLAIANGQAPNEALEEAEGHVESDQVALRVARLADRLQVATPIADAVGALLEGSASPTEALDRLMRRRVDRE